MTAIGTQANFMGQITFHKLPVAKGGYGPICDLHSIVPQMIPCLFAITYQTATCFFKSQIQDTQLFKQQEQAHNQTGRAPDIETHHLVRIGTGQRVG